MNKKAELVGERLNEAAALVLPLLEDGAFEDRYVMAVRGLLEALLDASQEDVAEVDAEPEIRTSLGADKNIMKRAVTKEADQVSLLSTLVVYTECHREGMPNHSRTYMDRVTAVRNHIDHFYQEKVQKFCGS